MKASILLLTLCAAVALNVQAESLDKGARRADMKAEMESRLKAADKNGDGKISREEAAALPRIAKKFDQIDTNKDGFVTLEEIKASMAQHAQEHGQHGAGGDHGGKMFEKLDANGDGFISREEAASHPKLAEHFDKLDSNKDGKLSKEELAAHRPPKGGK
ncbi:MAG: EF-hand domain-containing protein [Betaproteobacteria bacterium]|nr:EF-hand domain-containing protein [Betaproteobacteria bacterium]